MDEEKPLTLFIGTRRRAEHWAQANGWTRQEFNAKFIHYRGLSGVRGRKERIQIVSTGEVLSTANAVEAEDAMYLAALSNNINGHLTETIYIY